MHDHIPSLMRLGRVPGLSIATVRNGKIEETATFGVRNAETKEPVEMQTVFEAASLSKPVFSYAVLQLADAGKLELDRPLADLAPRIVPYDPASDLITARQVLAHMTGLPNWRGHKYPLRTYFTPGTRFSYSGEGFAYLQSVVEQNHRRGVRRPHDALGLRSAGNAGLQLSVAAALRRQLCRLARRGISAAAQFKPAIANAAYSLHTTASDYGRFLLAVLDGSRLKRKTALQWLTTQISVPKERFECLDPVPPEIDPGVLLGSGMGIGVRPRYVFPLGFKFWITGLRSRLARGPHGFGRLHEWRQRPVDRPRNCRTYYARGASLIFVAWTVAGNLA